MCITMGVCALLWVFDAHDMYLGSRDWFLEYGMWFVSLFSRALGLSLVFQGVCHRSDNLEYNCGLFVSTITRSLSLLLLSFHTPLCHQCQSVLRPHSFGCPCFLSCVPADPYLPLPLLLPSFQQKERENSRLK